MASIALIIPFFNERLRLKTEDLLELSLLGRGLLDIYLVDDGSTDGHHSGLQEFITMNNTHNIKILRSTLNLGKAEAIRFGTKQIDLQNYEYLGMTDADFSAPPQEIMRLASLVKEMKFGTVFGVRKNNSHNLIETSLYRRVQGTVFNKMVRKILGFRLLDSQCGLKYFQVDNNLIESLKQPFLNPWLFDLEILLRLKDNKRSGVSEIVLDNWSHVSNSKTSISDIGPVVKSIFLLRRQYGKIAK